MLIMFAIIPKRLTNEHKTTKLVTIQILYWRYVMSGFNGVAVIFTELFMAQKYVKMRDEDLSKDNVF
jgi:hypothetical protein